MFRFFFYKIPSLSHYTKEGLYGFFFMIKCTLWHICTAIRPISHCAVNIWICPLSHQSPRRFKQMKFKWNFLCTLWIRGWGKKFDFAWFSVQPCGLEHTRFNKISSYTSSKLASTRIFRNTGEYSSTSAASPRVCHSTSKTFTAWMFYASGIILYTLQLVCYFSLKILFNK